MKKIVISACLIGEKCRYNGLDSKSEAVMDKFEGGSLIQICPEQMGGLSTPRPAAEIVGGDGEDVLDGKARVITVERRRQNRGVPSGGLSRIRNRASTSCDPRHPQVEKSFLRLWKDLRRLFHRQPHR